MVSGPYNKTAEAVVEQFGYTAHIRRIVEEKKAAHYLALIKLASGLLWFRRWFE